MTKNLNKSKSKGSGQKKLGVSVNKLSKKKLKTMGRTARLQIDKLNAEIKDLGDIQTSTNLEKSNQDSSLNVLDSKSLQRDLKLDKDRKEKNDTARKELDAQLEFLEKVGL